MQEGQLLLCSCSSYLPDQISKPNFCALHNFLLVLNILMKFGRGIDKDQKGFHLQERQLSLSSLCSYLP